MVNGPDEITSQLKPRLLGRMTQRAVVEALKTGGPQSRMDLSRATGISATTVSSAVGLLAEAGYVEDAAVAAAVSGPGRPRQLLRLATASRVVGVAVEPEWCEMAAADLDGELIPEAQARFPTPNTYPRLLAEIERYAQQWTAAPPGRTLGVGLSLPGLFDPRSQRAVFSPNLHQTDQERPGVDLAARLGVRVTVLHEVDALGLAEQRAYPGEDLAVIDYGLGLGVGVLSGGRLLGRDLGLPLELGHLSVDPSGPVCGCGNHGCLETLATDAAFARRVSARVGRPLTVDEALARAAADPVGCAADVAAVLDHLAVAVAAVTNLFAPPRVVLHGRLLRIAPDLLQRLEALTGTRRLPPLQGVSQLELSTATKVTGAIAGVLDRLFESLGPVLPLHGLE